MPRPAHELIAGLHHEASVEDWVVRVVRERADFEEAAFSRDP